MMDVMFEIPSREDVEKCIITADTILKDADPTLVFSDHTLRKKRRSPTRARIIQRKSFLRDRPKRQS